MSTVSVPNGKSKSGNSSSPATTMITKTTAESRGGSS